MQSKNVPKLLAVTLIMVFLIGVGYWLVVTVGGYVADFTEKLSDNQDSLFEDASSLVEFLQKDGIDISEEIGEHFIGSLIAAIPAVLMAMAQLGLWGMVLWRG